MNSLMYVQNCILIYLGHLSAMVFNNLFITILIYSLFIYKHILHSIYLYVPTFIYSLIFLRYISLFTNVFPQLLIYIHIYLFILFFDCQFWQGYSPIFM